MHIDIWSLRKRMRSTVSVTAIPGATIKSILHHVKGHLEDTFPDHIILHHGTNDLKSNDTPQKIANYKLNPINAKVITI